MVVHVRRQVEPVVHRLLENRIARWQKRSHFKCANRYTANSRVAITFPINGAAAVGAEVETDARPRVGIALKSAPSAVPPHSLFQKSRTVMKRCSGSALTRFAVTQIDARRFPLGGDTQETAMALPSSFHSSLLIRSSLCSSFSSAITPY